MKKKKQIEHPDRWARLYKWKTLAQLATRPNSMKMYTYPSLIGGKLYYSDWGVKSEDNR